MKKYISFIILVISLIFLANYAWTGAPPAPIWSEFQAISDVAMNGFNITNADTITANNEIQADTPTTNQSLANKGYVDNNAGGNDGYLPDDPATSDADMNSNSIQNADTVDVETNVTYPDGTTQTTSPENCSSGEYLNTNGCESGASGGGSNPITTLSIDRTYLAYQDTIPVQKFTLKSGDTIGVYESQLTAQADSETGFETGVGFELVSATGDTVIHRKTANQSDTRINSSGSLIDSNQISGDQLIFRAFNENQPDTSEDYGYNVSGWIGVRFE